MGSRQRTGPAVGATQSGGGWGEGGGKTCRGLHEQPSPVESVPDDERTEAAIPKPAMPNIYSVDLHWVLTCVAGWQAGLDAGDLCSSRTVKDRQRRLGRESG